MYVISPLFPTKILFAEMNVRSPLLPNSCMSKVHFFQIAWLHLSGKIWFPRTMHTHSIRGWVIVTSKVYGFIFCFVFIYFLLNSIYMKLQRRQRRKIIHIYYILKQNKWISKFVLQFNVSKTLTLNFNKYLRRWTKMPTIQTI